jgi:hypothetical protein
MNCYSVKGWNKHYEKAQTRKVEHAQWVPVPLKHDGKGFRRLMAMKGGLEVYAVWMLILQVAAKCPTRGTLMDEDGPLTAEDMALKTGCPESAFNRAFEVLASERIGWMLVSSWYPPAKSLELQDSTGQDNTEQDRTEVRPETAPAVIVTAVLTFPTDGNPREWDLTEAKVKEFREAFPSLDVVAECRKALAWVQANPTKRKTPRGMPGCLFRWWSRVQDRGGMATTAAKPALFRFGEGT